MSLETLASNDTLSISRSQRGSYIFSKDRLVAIFAVLQGQFDKTPTVTIELTDSRSITSDNLGQLLADPFLESTAISSVSFTVYARENRNRASVYLRNTWLDAVRYEVSGERNFCLSTEQSLLSLFSAARAWYGWTNLNNYNMLIQFIVVSPVAFVIAVLVSLQAGEVPAKSPPVLFYISMILILVAIPWISHRLSPKIVFDFGKGKVLRERVLRPARWLFSAIVLAMLAAFFREQLLEWLRSTLGQAQSST